MKEWGHTVSMPGAYTVSFLILFTTLSCEVYTWKVRISSGEVSRCSRRAVCYRRIEASLLYCSHSIADFEKMLNTAPNK